MHLWPPHLAVLPDMHGNFDNKLRCQNLTTRILNISSVDQGFLQFYWIEIATA